MPVVLAFPNRFERALSLSGQGWVSTLPLSYLETRQIGEVARAQQPIARLFLQLPTATAAELITLVGHNMGTSGKVRARAWASDPRTPLDTSSKAAVLDLPFIDWTALPSAFTFSSAAGTYWGADGLLKSAGANVPRFTHDRTTGACLGLLLEGAQENRVLWCRDGTNAAWTKNAAMAAPALTATGIDGVANTATRLTASSANAQIKQTVSASGSPRAGAWLRRHTGNGTIRMSGDNFGSNTTVALTSSWQFFSVAHTSGSSFGIQIDTAGDVIEMDFAYVGLFASTGPGPTPILTTSATVTRAGDTLTYTIPTAQQPSTLNGGMVWRGTVVTPANVAGSNDTTLVSAGGATSMSVTLLQSSSNAVRFNAFSTTLWGGSAPTLGSRLALAFGWAATATHYASQNAGSMSALVTPNTVAGALTSLTLSPASSVSVIHDRLSLFSATLNGTDVTALANQTATEPAPAFDSGWLDAWPAAWLAATTAEQQEGADLPAIIRTGTLQTYPWWRLDLSDPTNAAGFVELGRVFMGAAWTPPRGMASGASTGFINRASITEAYSGAEYFDDNQANPRIHEFELPCLNKEDAVLIGLEMQRQLGTTRELFVIWDSADAVISAPLSFLARLYELRRPVARRRNQWALPFSVKQLL